jgi:predicted esterase
VFTCSGKAVIIRHRQQRRNHELVVRSPFANYYLLFPILITVRFDCYSFDIPNRPEDEEGLYKAVGYINEIVSLEMKNHNIPSNRIIIGGISQGSAVSILTTLISTRPFAGVFVLSGCIPLRKKAKEACPMSCHFQ